MEKMTKILELEVNYYFRNIKKIKGPNKYNT